MHIQYSQAPKVQRVVGDGAEWAEEMLEIYLEDSSAFHDENQFWQLEFSYFLSSQKHRWAVFRVTLSIKIDCKPSSPAEELSK